MINPAPGERKPGNLTEGRAGGCAL